MFFNLVTNFVLCVYKIFSHKYNYILKNELISFDFIVKVKITDSGYQNIICSDIINYDNQKYPDEIFIENKNGTKKNISGGIYKINLEENENLVTMKWYTYPNSTTRMFYNCVNITEIDLTQFDLTFIINMIHMF